jgi:hypothetical protein
MKKITIARSCLIWLISISIFILLDTKAYCEPIVTGISGKLSNGQTVTVNGNSFGIKNTPGPVVWDNIEAGSFSNNWSSTNSLSVTNISRHAYSNKAGYCNMNSEKWCNFEGGSDSQTWFVQYWFYLGSNFNWANDINSSLGNVKFFRMWSTSGSAQDNFVVAWNGYDVVGVAELVQTPSWNPVLPGFTYVDKVLGYADPGWVDPGYMGWKHFTSTITKQAWHQFQFEYSDSSTSTGIFRMWVDGKQIINKTNLSTRGQNHQRPKVVGFYNSHSANASNADFYIDDAYIDNTWQRVEICNNANYNNCTLKEIQPATSWNDTSISFTVNQGSFTDGTVAYVFVTDANGVRNTGHSITIGSSVGGSADTSVPLVSISTPASNAVVSGNATITASASDNVGVSKVEFYLDSTSLPAVATAMAVPYTFLLNTLTVSNGLHTIYAKAYDAAGNNATSTGITVTVSNAIVDSTPPVVSITSPASNVTLTGITPVIITVSDNVGVTKVDYFVDNTSSTPIGTNTSAPFTFNWDPSTLSNGSHVLYARASDAAGNIALSSVAVTIQLSNPSPATLKRNECTTPPSGTVFCEDFEGTNPKSNFNDYDGNPDTENLIVVDNGPSNDPSNKSIRLRVPSGLSGTSDLVKVLPSSYDKLFARWYFKYEPGFNFSAPNHGGGLTAGDRSYIGLSGNRPTGSDWASFLFQYLQNTSVPFAYTYYRGMYQNCANPNGSCWGDSFPCVYDSGSISCTKPQDLPTVTLPALVAGQWYCYEQMVDMGGASVDGAISTGRITQWLNGGLIGDNTNLWLRTSPTLKIQNLWLALFHHDGTHSTVGELIDNVVVSTQRIGCGGTIVLSPVQNVRPIQIIP